MKFHENIMSTVETRSKHPGLSCGLSSAEMAARGAVVALVVGLVAAMDLVIEASTSTFPEGGTAAKIFYSYRCPGETMSAV